MTEIVTIWECSICGASRKNRSNWCDLGCGRDYNQMIEHKDCEIKPRRKLVFPGVSDLYASEIPEDPNYKGE